MRICTQTLTEYLQFAITITQEEKDTIPKYKIADNTTTSHCKYTDRNQQAKLCFDMQHKTSTLRVIDTKILGCELIIPRRKQRKIPWRIKNLNRCDTCSKFKILRSTSYIYTFNRFLTSSNHALTKQLLHHNWAKHVIITINKQHKLQSLIYINSIS